MLNPRLELKTVFLANAVEAFKEDLRKISTMFPQALITVGYIPGTTNPADALTKIINSSIYRYGPESFGTREGLGQDVVATCQAGVFRYLGLPSRYLPRAAGGRRMCGVSGGREMRSGPDEGHAEEG